MENKYSNLTNLSLSMAVFLATDEYDHNNDPKSISVTTLLKPIKQIILTSRLAPGSLIVDVTSMIKSRIGTAIHSAAEKAWLNNHKSAMKSLGYSDYVIDQVKINPTDEEIERFEENQLEYIPVYVEQRTEKQFEDFTITGQYDFIFAGTLEDIKSTSVYTYMNKSKDLDYRLQGSIYRWLNPDKIISDYMDIQYIFTDWSASGKFQNKNYPPAQQLPYRISLMSLQETEAFIKNKLNTLKQYWDMPEEDLPMCTDAELWKSPTVYKYYKDPEKISGRSTKNFTNLSEAQIRLNDDGNVGMIIPVEGTAKACQYCPAFTICKQKDLYYSNN